MLADRCRDSWGRPNDEASHDLWKSISLLGVRLFGQLLTPEVSAQLEPVPAAGPHATYALLTSSLEAGVARVEAVAVAVETDDRRRELTTLAHVRREMRPPDGTPWLAFLGKVHLIERASDRVVAELDGIFIDFFPDRVTWHFIETKVARQSGERRQLADALRYLRHKTTVPISMNGPDGDIAYVSFTTPLASGIH
jgi:hypothetical protein